MATPEEFVWPYQRKLSCRLLMAVSEARPAVSPGRQNFGGGEIFSTSPEGSADDRQDFLGHPVGGDLHQFPFGELAAAVAAGALPHVSFRYRH
jgi:hypothetical protein